MVKILVLSLMVFAVLSAWAACIVAGEADDREERWFDGRSDRTKKGDCAIMDADVCVTWNGVISDDDAVDIAIKSTKGSVISSIVNLPSAQPTEASCWGCNCQKMERLKEQKTFSEMVHLHDAETHEERTETHACDLISRQAAIDAHYEYCNKHPDAGFPVWSLKILEDLPSAQPDLSEYSDKLWKAAYERGKAEAQQRWIPCSERLPEDGQEILATTTDNAWGDVVIIRTYYKEMHKSVIAWMPLPEPYAERRTDEA